MSRKRTRTPHAAPEGGVGGAPRESKRPLVRAVGGPIIIEGGEGRRLTILNDWIPLPEWAERFLARPALQGRYEVKEE